MSIYMEVSLMDYLKVIAREALAGLGAVGLLSLVCSFVMWIR